VHGYSSLFTTADIDGIFSDCAAIVEYTMEDEKHVITKPACVTMPPKLVHCPISIKNVSAEKLIIFMAISLASEYGEPNYLGKSPKE
jgi:hypothetical protein